MFFCPAPLIQKLQKGRSSLSPPHTTKLTHQEGNRLIYCNTQTQQQRAKHKTAAQDLCLQLHGSTQDINTVTDCSFTVHRGTDQRHTKSRGKPWQHTATKSSTTTMKGSSEARKSREQLSLFYPQWQQRAQQSKFLLHCNKHTNTKGIRCYRI